MTTQPQTEPELDDLEGWLPFDDAYNAFVDAHPMLGLGRGSWPAQNVRRNFGAQLVELGGARQIVNRRWFAHRERFGPALFEAMARKPADVLGGGRPSRSAA